MRVFPLLTNSKLRRRAQRWRRHRRSPSIESLTLSIETVIFFSVLLFTLTGSRAAFLDRLGSRSDLVVILLFLVLFALLHWLFRRHFLSRIKHYISVTSYDDRQIFFGLGQEVRRAENTERLYLAIANRIASFFEADDVSILVGDEATGDYIRVISSSRPSDFQPKLKLGSRAFVVKRLKSYSTPLTIAKTDLDTWDRALITASPTLRHDRAREHETLRELKSHLLVQLRTKDQMTGILSLGLRRRQFGYSDRDKELLMSIASQLALVIENAKLANRMVAQERLNRELALAAEVQQQLLPSDPPRGESVEVAGFCQPASGVGGDYYDFIPSDNQKLGIAIADVSGKGMPAALLMSTVQATLRSLSLNTGVQPKSYGELSDMVSKLNRLLCNSTGGSSYATFFYAQFDERTRRLAYVNAGHNPPLCLRANSSNDFVELSAGGLMVGAFDHCSYEQESFQMQAGDLLFAFTDGLTEALNSEGEEFGESRVKETLAASARLSVNEIRDEIIRRVKEWCFGAPHYDDLTFVVMKVI